MSNDLHTVFLTKKDLLNEVQENNFWTQKKLYPISQNKLNWILSNPRLEENDYCLLLGYDSDTLIATIYIIPDLINTKNNLNEKVFWLVEWWVRNDYKDTVLGAYMYNEAMRLCNQKILIKGHANNADKFYEKQPYTKLISNDDQTVFLGIEINFLTTKFSFLKPISGFVSVFSGLLNYILLKINKRKNKKRTQKLHYTYLDTLDNETWDFIKNKFKNDLIHKSRDYINWQIDIRQHIQVPVIDKMSFSSLISGSGSRNYIYSFNVKLNDEIIGFISFLQFNNEVYLKYLVGDQEHNPILVDALMEHLIALKIQVVYTYGSDIADLICNKYKKVFRFKRKNKSLIHESIADNAIHLHIHNRDGHFI